MNVKRRVTQSFDAKQTASRRRETFATGELLMMLDGPEAPLQLRFMRINGLRPQRGVECQYLIEPAELGEKTETAK
jgi:hypothetical protein